MLIHAMAKFPLRSESLSDALAQVADYARQHLVTAKESEIYFAVGERGARINRVLAALIPSDAKEFYLGTSRVGAPLTSAQFLDEVAKSKPERTHSMVTLKASDLRDPLAPYGELARVVPASGRGVLLIFTLRGWRFGGDVVADVDFTLSRFRHGARAISAGLNIRFHALSLKDPVVKATIAAASEVGVVKFGKPMVAFAGAENMPFGAPATPVADARLERPAPEAQVVVLKAFEEALARASDQIGAKPEDLATVPLLFSRSGGFDKRMKDVMAGKNEAINLPSRLKRFVREQFPAYTFDAGDAEQLWFRRTVAPTLDLLLMFDKVHQWGLGKTFTVEFGVDFPNTPFGGMHTGMGGSRRNIFWLFHEAWEKQVWAYTTKEELETALESCAGVLRRVLPAIEQHCQELLLPVPSELPKNIEQRGAMSARQAYEAVLPLARGWADDVELESIASVNVMNTGYPIGQVESSIDDNGRLRRSGSWGFKFLSKKLDRYCFYTVPHTGRIWWSFYPVLQGAIPKYSSVLRADDTWLDSTEIAPRAFAELRKQSDGFLVHSEWLALRDPKRYAEKFVWEASCICYRSAAPERRHANIQLDPRTGEVLDIQHR